MEETVSWESVFERWWIGVKKPKQNKNWQQNAKLSKNPVGIPKGGDRAVRC